MVRTAPTEDDRNKTAAKAGKLTVGLMAYEVLECRNEQDDHICDESVIAISDSSRPTSDCVGCWLACRQVNA